MKLSNDAGADVLYGEEGDDVIKGGGGPDILYGGTARIHRNKEESCILFFQIRQSLRRSLSLHEFLALQVSETTA